jgi:Smg protein
VIQAAEANIERPAIAADNPADRKREIGRLRAESRARIAEILDPESREWVISGLMNLGGDEIETDHVRWMTLIVLWSRGLIEHFTHLEDMLLNHEPGRLH